MLKSIHLKNLALIEEAEIDYDKGLNIMTGETGSGKSIIIGSVNIALGEKANKSMIRSGASFALSELSFISDDPKVFKTLDELQIERDGNNILITRKITPDSSSCKINGESVTLANLRRITSLLIDVHGQHDHQSLLDPGKHLSILDDFGGEETFKIKSELAGELSAYRKLREEYREFDKDEEALAREIPLIEYEANEIDSSELTLDEDTKLEAEYKTLSKAERTSDLLSRVSYMISDDSSGLLKSSSDALKELEEASRIDPELASFKSSLTDIDSLLKDLGHDLAHYIDKNGFDRERFRQISERLNVINHLKSRYGDSVSDILSYSEDCHRRLERYSDFSAHKEKLEAALEESKGRVNELAKKLSEARKTAAAQLEPLIIENLKDLNFLNVEFRIDFELAQKISASGFDKVQFMISLNPGEPLKPLSSVASGGELSRIMLALKSALAKNDHIETLIFDEIDTGISGNTAAKVSEKLVSLSKDHQIICITHLPQIASKADNHYLIEKEVVGESTISEIRLLNKEASVRELAKMISGSEVTEAAIEHARELKGL